MESEESRGRGRKGKQIAREENAEAGVEGKGMRWTEKKSNEKHVQA